MSKPKDVTAKTVFAEAFGFGRPTCPPDIQVRRVGVFFYHDVNPNAVNAKGISVVRIDADSVRVKYARIVPADGESDRSWFPSGVVCAGGDGMHKQAVRDSFVATWAEVAL